MPELPRLEWKGFSISIASQVISFLKTRRMVEKGCLAYLAYIRDTTVEFPTTDLVPVVREFADVFPSDLTGFSSIAAPLTRLNQKGAPFRWSDDCETSFQKLKTSLTTTQVLVLPLGSGMYTVYYDASRVGLGCIKAPQFDDAHLAVLRETILQGGVKEVSMGEDGVLRLQGHPCVPNVDGFRERILEEARSSRYSIHPGAMKMYCDLRLHYWWRRMKKDIVEYVARCLSCQQVKYEHQRSGGLLQQMIIPKWKCERITMDFIVGLPWTLRSLM
ncbi:uncharacterized protein [Nicotiana sylvestris]|uniref:uncharacterized protein n=1 Tax=Nicotiana sylvestris TaxID=4096 RepID=UPI00388C3A0C